MNVRNRLLTILALVLSTSCMVEKGEVNIKLPGAKNFRNSEITKATVTNVQIINDQLVITGSNLNVVTNIKTENATKSFSESFTIESKSNSQIIANSKSPLSFAVNSLFNLVLSNSYGAATFQINFSLCDATINGKGINCSVVANDKDVLSYDSVSDTWRPRQVNGLNYLGTFDASPGIAPTAQPSGSYYVISVSGTIGAINFDVGDWIVSNGTAYQKIDNSTAIISVFGRTGAVTGAEGDYSLDLLSDVDLLTTPPTAGKILKYNGTHWVVSDDLSSGGAGSVSSSEIADGSIATADLANASVTDAKISSIAASKITGTVNGSQIGSGVITNSHIAAGAAIDYSKLNITNGTIPYAHVNVGAGEIAQDRIAGFSTALSNLLTGTITNGDTTHAPTGDAVFDALGLKLNLTGGTLSVGTINGVPTPVNGDDIVNKAYVDSAVTGATTTANDKVSKTGDTMTGVLVLPSNGLTVGTNQLTVSGGNVGIGTTTPIAPLHLIGGGASYANAFVVDSSAASGGSTIILGNNTTDGDQVRVGVNGFLRSQTGLFGLDTTSPTAPLAFSVNSNEKMRILDSGNVGIGTTTPAQKLDVAGNINATQLCIAGDCKSSWPTGLATNSVTSTEITDGSIMNADINAGAAIAQSKISGLATDLSNKQPLDAGLTNLSTYNTNGILVQSADNTFVGRSLAGTANRLDVANGDGVSGNPTLNINPTLLPSPTASGYFLKSTGADASVWSLLSSGDITTALGFTPINKAGDTLSTGTIAFNAIGTLSLGYTPTNLTDATSKSYVDNLVATAVNQWTESSGNIYRNSGNVGIGTTTPATPLTVNGSALIGSASTGFTGTWNALVIGNTALGPHYIMDGGSTTNRIRTLWNSSKYSISKCVTDSCGSSNSMFSFDFTSKVFEIPGAKISLAGSTPTNDLEFPSGGTRKIGFDRTNTSESDLEIHAGAPPVGSTDRQGGDLILKSGISTGTGDSGMQFFTVAPSATGTTENNPLLRMTILPDGNIGMGTANPSQKLEVAGNVQSNDTFFTIKTFTDGWVVGDYQEFVQANQVGGAGSSGVFKITLAGTRGNWTEATTFTTIGSHADSDTWREIPATMVNYYTTSGHRCFTVDANTGLNVVKFRIRAINPSSICSASSTGNFPIYVKAVSEGYNGGWITLSGNGTGATVSGFRTTYGSEWNLYTGASRNAGIQTITAKDGNVGIGTTNPSYKLEVAGSGNFTTSSAGGIQLALENTTMTSTNKRLRFVQDNASTVTRVSNNADSINYMSFQMDTGNMGIGLTDPQARLDVNGNVNTPGIGVMRLRNQFNSGGTRYWQIGPDGNGNGNFVVYNEGLAGAYIVHGQTTWSSSSDKRLKKNIEPLTNSLDKLNKLNGVKYHYNKDHDEELKKVGVIAQDVKKVLPEAVTEADGFLSVKYTELIPLTINAIKEFYVEFKMLVSKVLGLEVQVEKHSRAIASIEERNKKLEKENVEMKRRADKLEAENKEVRKALCELGKKAFCR